MVQKMRSHLEANPRRFSVGRCITGLDRGRLEALRLGLRTFGRLSGGVSLGCRAGFASGALLDYVYENRASGTTRLGRALDRRLLDTVAWRCLRVRLRNVHTTLLECMGALRERNAAPRIIDVACGSARATLDALHAHPDSGGTALLLDHDPEALELVRHRASALGLEQRIKLVRCDLSDGRTAARLQNVIARSPFNLAVVAGHLEWVSDDAAARLVNALSRRMPAGSGLVYSGMPRHPNYELLTRCVAGTPTEPCVSLRQRSTASLDAIVSTAGFVKRGMRTDPDGVFTVSVAEKPE